jgi:hypothetical protein
VSERTPSQTSPLTPLKRATTRYGRKTVGKTARTLAVASVALLALALAGPARAGDVKFGFGAGATFPVWSLLGFDVPADYKTGWLVTARGLWIPRTSPFGVRVAGYYGQIPVTNDILWGDANSTLSGGGADLNLAFRLAGKGPEGLYLNAGIGFRTLRQEVEDRFSQTFVLSDTNISYNGGFGVSLGPAFGEVNVVYFKLQNSEFLAVPVTVGFQF